MILVVITGRLQNPLIPVDAISIWYGASLLLHHLPIAFARLMNSASALDGLQNISFS
jgi:hypothetical protein